MTIKNNRNLYILLTLIAFIGACDPHDPNAPSSNNVPPASSTLIEDLKNAKPEKYEELVKAVLENSDKEFVKNSLSTVDETTGKTPLHYLAQANLASDSNTLQQACKAAPELCAKKDKNGDTILHVLIKKEETKSRNENMVYLMSSNSELVDNKALQLLSDNNFKNLSGNLYDKIALGKSTGSPQHTKELEKSFDKVNTEVRKITENTTVKQALQREDVKNFSNGKTTVTTQTSKIKTKEYDPLKNDSPQATTDMLNAMANLAKSKGQTDNDIPYLKTLLNDAHTNFSAVKSLDAQLEVSSLKARSIAGEQIDQDALDAANKKAADEEAQLKAEQERLAKEAEDRAKAEQERLAKEAADKAKAEKERLAEEKRIEEEKRKAALTFTVPSAISINDVDQESMPDATKISLLFASARNYGNGVQVIALDFDKKYINALNSDGNTLIHAVVLNKSHGSSLGKQRDTFENNIKILIKAGADPFIKNNDKKTALDIAKGNNRFDPDFLKTLIKILTHYEPEDSVRKMIVPISDWITNNQAKDLSYIRNEALEKLKAIPFNRDANKAIVEKLVSRLTAIQPPTKDDITTRRYEAIQSLDWPLMSLKETVEALASLIN